MMTSSKTFTISQPDQSVWLTEPGEYEIRLIAPRSSVEIKGGWRVSGQEKAEVKLKIIHAAPHTYSNTLLRGVATDRAQITLSGTIIVQENASDTNAFLTENVLLLSPTAVAHAVPNLEISTDEVKCSHAATISPIPESQLFYLQSRGIPRNTAEDIISQGFLLPTQPVPTK